MGDSLTEIDLDSVIDRLLEGASLHLASGNMVYECERWRLGV